MEVTDVVQWARRELDLIPPQAIVSWAADELAAGCVDPEMIALASTWDDSANSVDHLLSALLLSRGLQPLTRIQSARLVALLIAREISDGIRTPYEGAREIWTKVAAAVPEVEPELRAFVGLASEWEDDENHRSELENDIVKEAQRYLLTSR